jgi:hypothetical protein
MVLYTSGYQLFTHDYVSELGEALGANQISTEQRFFGTSVPVDLSPEMWKNVSIEQAASDHHRIVEALRGFYQRPWLSTGHSKGGMTSIFHRRFFPRDVDATVAYVAPISYAAPDPRYVPFLDSIGEEDCRQAVRAVQRRALERFAVLQPMARQEAEDFFAGTFERSQGHAAAHENALTVLEWVFWQHGGGDFCFDFTQPPDDDLGLYELMRSWVGVGQSDSDIEGGITYDYQAQTELGLQKFSTTHLDDLRQFADVTINYAPAGTNPVHDPAKMEDVQDWVLREGSEILFLYGEYDPWTGGAYQVGEVQDGVIKLIAPRANHGAMLTSLESRDREAALGLLDRWMDTRPEIGAPTGAPVPPGLGRGR